jgi:hypothetical protein
LSTLDIRFRLRFSHVLPQWRSGVKKFRGREIFSIAIHKENLSESAIALPTCEEFMYRVPTMHHTTTNNGALFAFDVKERERQWIRQ